MFKSELLLDEAKQFYTALINRHIHDPERRLKVFDPNGVYLPTKKIGKNNPKAAEIEADNAARQDWNRTADMALVSGIEESKIIEIRNEHVYDEATRSVQKHGWRPGLFREGHHPKGKGNPDGIDPGDGGSCRSLPCPLTSRSTARCRS